MAITEAARRWRVEGPVPGTPTLLLGNFDLGEHGYVVEEFFIDGRATSFSEGDGGVQTADEAEYRTRFVVVRPSDPSASSGTVVVEWLNVSGGGDGCPDWAFMHRQIMRTRQCLRRDVRTARRHRGRWDPRRHGLGAEAGGPGAVRSAAASG